MYCMCVREERRGGPSVLYERGKEGGTQCIV